MFTNVLWTINCCLMYNMDIGRNIVQNMPVLELIDRIIVEMDKNNTSVNIFLDLFKSIDTIDHTLLDKLMGCH